MKVSPIYCTLASGSAPLVEGNGFCLGRPEQGAEGSHRGLAPLFHRPCGHGDGSQELPTLGCGTVWGRSQPSVALHPPVQGEGPSQAGKEHWAVPAGPGAL